MSNLVSLQIEKHCIAGLIQNQNAFAEVEGFLNERDFCAKPHDVIYSCLKSSLLNNEKVDKVLLAQKIKNLGISFKDDINIFDYIDAITFTPITYDATINYSKELVKLRVLRNLSETCNEIQAHIGKSINQPLQKTISEVDGIYGKTIDTLDEEDGPQDLFATMHEDVEARGNAPVEELGFATPYPEFNKFYGGMVPGNVYCVASRSGEGKSSFLDETAIEMGGIHKVPVLILDTEMETNQVKFRTAASKTGIPLWYLTTGNFRKNKEFTETVRARLPNLKKQYRAYHYYVGNKSVDEICSIIKRWVLSVNARETGSIVVFDYIKILANDKLSGFNQEYQAILATVQKLKLVAVDYNFSLLTAVQINRTGENKGRKSDDVVDDASVISASDRLQWLVSYLGIFRQRTFDEIALDTPESGTHKLITLKAREMGKHATGHNHFTKRTFPDGTSKYVRNFINFNIEGFKIEERGSLEHSIQRQNSQFLLTTPPNPHNHHTPL